jgi:hypothetical protein
MFVLKIALTCALSDTGTIQLKPRINTDEHGFRSPVWNFKGGGERTLWFADRMLLKTAFHQCLSVCIRG